MSAVNNQNRFTRRLYAIRDDKLAMFNFPIVVDNDEVAKRMFGDALSNSQDSVMSKHPEDFSIWFLGYFDCESGVLNSAVDTVCIARGTDYFASVDKE